MVDAVSSVQKYSSSGSSETSSAEDTDLFNDIETAGKTSDSDNDIDMVLEKLGIPESDKEKLKTALTDAGKTSYADILDYLDSDDDGTVETSEIDTAITKANDLEGTGSEEDDHHDTTNERTRNGTNAFDSVGSDDDSGDDGDDDESPNIDSDAKTPRYDGQEDPDYVDAMFNSTSGKAENSFFKQDLEAFLKPESGKAPDAGKLALILQKMGFAKKDDAENPVANTELAQDIIDYSGDYDGSDDEGEFSDLIELLMGERTEYNSSDKNDNNADVATHDESNTALEKFINTDETTNGIDPTVKASIARLNVDGRIIGAGPTPVTPREPADEADDVYLKRIFELQDQMTKKTADSFLQDDIKAFMYNSDPNVIDEGKLATLLQTMGVTGTDPTAPPTDLAHSIAAYITSMQTAGTPQDKLLDFLLGNNADVKATTGDSNNGIIEKSEALSVLVQFINHPDRADAKTKTILPDKGSILDLPAEPISDRGRWEAYLHDKGITTTPQDYDALISDVAKANNKAVADISRDEMIAFLNNDNDKLNKDVTLAEALLSRFSNSNNGFAITPSNLRTYLDKSENNPFTKGQLLNEYLVTIGINGGDAAALKDMLMDKSTEDMVAFLTAGQADGGKPITPSQIQKNIMGNGNPRHDILDQGERDKIATFSGGGVYNAGIGATTDTQFAGLSPNEMANALKNGLIDVKTYLNMGGDDPNTPDIENDFSKLNAEQKKEKLKVIQESRGKRLEDLYPQQLITVQPSIDNLTLDQAMMLTGTDGRAIADAHINDVSLLKSGEFFSADAFRMMAMQYTNEELAGNKDDPNDGKLVAMVKAIYTDLGLDYETSTAGKDVIAKYKERVKDGFDGDEFNKFIGELFDDADDDGAKDGLYSKDAMKKSLNILS